MHLSRLTGTKFIFLIFIVLGIYTSILPAAIAPTINYQGYLADAAGAPVSGPQNATFRIYQQLEGGSILWTEPQAFTVTNGLFHVQLGSVTPFPDNLFDNPVFLGIEIADDGEMAPRLSIGSVPSSFITEKVLSCAVGETNCNGICANLQNDLNHCGVCGNACASEEACGSGTCFPDRDGDGWGADGGGDCNDTNALVNPGATEVCDGIDNDCDAAIDDGLSFSTYYRDADMDDFGDPGNSVVSCNQPSGYVLDNSDCDDANGDINPGAVEVCDGVDNDCSAGSDEGGNLSCDDMDACTVDVCDGVSGCGYTAFNCDDGDACTADICDSGTGCNYTDVSCDDGNQCTADACDSATGCSNTVMVGAECDDGDPDTDGDVCTPAGDCAGDPV